MNVECEAFTTTSHLLAPPSTSVAHHLGGDRVTCTISFSRIGSRREPRHPPRASQSMRSAYFCARTPFGCVVAPWRSFDDPKARDEPQSGAFGGSSATGCGAPRPARDHPDGTRSGGPVEGVHRNVHVLVGHRVDERRSMSSVSSARRALDVAFGLLRWGTHTVTRLGQQVAVLLRSLVVLSNRCSPRTSGPWALTDSVHRAGSWRGTQWLVVRMSCSTAEWASDRRESGRRERRGRVPPVLGPCAARHFHDASRRVAISPGSARTPRRRS